MVAVEPTRAFRSYGALRHPSPRIEWVDDGLPDLRSIAGRGQTFDLVLLSAVWMHLDARDRARAMPVLASLLAPGGLLLMSLRHGPVPAGRVMFEVPPEEAISSAAAGGLALVLDQRGVSLQVPNRQAGVTWSHLAFTKPAP